MKRMCSKCQKQITRRHKWHMVKSRFLFFWTVEHPTHHDCDFPEMGARRLKKEPPLPFPDTNESYLSPREEIANL